MVNNKGLVRFHMLQSFTLPERKKLKAFVSSLMKKENKPFLSLDYIFCTDDYLLEINQSYLKHDDLTDIITFDLSDPEDNNVIGEIYISVERIKENANSYETSFLDELHRVMFHGALHLCGYKDKSKADQEIMRSKEGFYLEKFK